MCILFCIFRTSSCLVFVLLCRPGSIMPFSYSFHSSMGVAAGCCTGTGVGTTGGLAVAALSIGLSVPDAGPADGVVAGAPASPDAR